MYSEGSWENEVLLKCECKKSKKTWKRQVKKTWVFHENYSRLLIFLSVLRAPLFCALCEIKEGLFFIPKLTREITNVPRVKNLFLLHKRHEIDLFPSLDSSLVWTSCTTKSVCFTIMLLVSRSKIHLSGFLRKKWQVKPGAL